MIGEIIPESCIHLCEEPNNKAKLIIHRAYGFRTAGNYIRNLYHCMADLPLPQTVHTFV